MLTQSYYTPRMEYSTTGTYVTPTIYPMTPPYTNGYDHTEFLQHIGIKSTYDHSTLSRYLEREHNIPATIFYSNSSSSNCIQQLPPTPPSLSTSPVSTTNYYRYPTTNSNENINQQYEEFIGSDCATSNKNEKQIRKSVIMKIETEPRAMNNQLSSSNLNPNSPVQPRTISDGEEEFICKWEFCYK